MVIVGVGLLITGPLNNLPGEAVVNEWFVALRTPALDSVTAALSAIGTTEFIIGACVLFVALFWWRTKQWWLALVPPQAIAVQAIVFMTAALVVGRERPDVEKLDDSPPTSTYPSGHTGASTAFYVVLAMLAQRIGNRVLRVVVTVVCLLDPDRRRHRPALPRHAQHHRRDPGHAQRAGVRVPGVELPAPGHLVGGLDVIDGPQPGRPLTVRADPASAAPATASERTTSGSRRRHAFAGSSLTRASARTGCVASARRANRSRSAAESRMRPRPARG